MQIDRSKVRSIESTPMEKLHKLLKFRFQKPTDEEHDNFLKKKTRIIWVMGPKSCGNAIISSMLAECSGFQLIDVSKLLLLYSLKEDSFPNAAVIAKCLEREKLVPDNIVIQILKEEINLTYKDVEGFIISGYPRKISQANKFVKHICNIDVIIHINLRLDAFLTRLLFGDSKIDLNRARIQFIKFNRKMRPIKKKFEDKVIDVKCIFPKEDAVTRLMDILEDDYGYKFKRLYTK